MNTQRTEFPEAMTLEAIERLQEASALIVRALRPNAGQRQAQDAGAMEYDSWAARLEYDSWSANFHRQ